MYLSGTLKKHQREYYRLLSAVRTEGDWEAWVSFFLEAVDGAGTTHVYSQVFAPGKNQALVAMDSSTTMVAVGTVHLYNFIPPEKQRLSGIAALFSSHIGKTLSSAKKVSPRSQIFAQLAQRVAALKASRDVLAARIAELDASWDAFDPTRFTNDRIAVDPVLDQNTAEANAKSADTEQIYTGLFNRSVAGQLRPQSLQPITLISPF